MEQFAAGQGLRLHGLHHEVYLSDPRRVAPERLRTILRHPREEGLIRRALSLSFFRALSSSS